MYYSILLSFKYKDPRFLTSCVISRTLPKSTIIPHPVGIVIGKENGVSIGENCTIMQNVSIGIAKLGDLKGPSIGDNVFIGASAIIVGDIKIGNNVNIGAGSFVNFNVPDNSLVVGEKSKIIPQVNSL